MIKKSLIATFGLFLLPQSAQASCSEHWAFNGEDADILCKRVLEYNSLEEIPVFRRRPECPKDGPDSKCNPSSITVPEGESASIITIGPEFAGVRRITDPLVLDILKSGKHPNFQTDGTTIGGWAAPPTRDSHNSSTGATVFPDLMGQKSISNHLNSIRRGDSVFILMQDQ